MNFRNTYSFVNDDGLLGCDDMAPVSISHSTCGVVALYNVQYECKDKCF